MDKKYCPSCGQDAPVERSLEGRYLLLCCEFCGLGLGVQLASAEVIREFRGESQRRDSQPSLGKLGLKKRVRAVAPVIEKPVRSDPRSNDPRAADPRAAQTPVPKQPNIGTSSDWQFGAIPRINADGSETPAPKPSPRRMRRVMVVEDSDFLREVTRDILAERQLAREVIDCPDGQDFVERFTRMATEGKKPDLVILDVRMPGLDGREAAYALRAIESAMSLKRTPILFFSALLCDAEFKATLKDIRNARYIRKADDNPQRLGERIATVLERLVDGARGKS